VRGNKGGRARERKWGRIERRERGGAEKDYLFVWLIVLVF
jgi:hypothetical protein